MTAPRWGVAATVRAPAEQVMAFAAWHLDLGAARVILHFDDPDDPAADRVARTPGIRVIRCDSDYWRRLCGRRPPTHQLRQMRNITRACRQAPLEWIAHLDVDEFLLADRPVAEILAATPADAVQLRAAPWEALHDPALPDDIFTARQFRRALPRSDPALADILTGGHGALLPRGVLSHTAGKCLFRARVPGMVANIHGARIGGVRIEAPFQPELSILHFHAEDPARWLAGLEFRLTRGAYQFLPALQAHLAALDLPGRRAFWQAVQIARPEALDRLAALGLLRDAGLGLRARVNARFGSD